MPIRERDERRELGTDRWKKGQIRHVSELALSQRGIGRSKLDAALQPGRAWQHYADALTLKLNSYADAIARGASYGLLHHHGGLHGAQGQDILSTCRQGIPSTLSRGIPSLSDTATAGASFENRDHPARKAARLLRAELRGTGSHYVQPAPSSRNHNSGITRPARLDVENIVNEAVQFLLRRYDTLSADLSEHEKAALEREVTRAYSVPPAASALPVEIAGPLLNRAAQVAVTARGVVGELALRRRLLDTMIPVNEAAQRLSTSTDDIECRLSEGSLVGLPDDEGFWHAASWQFDESQPAGLVAGLPEVLDELKGRAPLNRVGWLATPKTELGSRAPIELLREGHPNEVLRLARASSRA